MATMVMAKCGRMNASKIFLFFIFLFLLPLEAKRKLTEEVIDGEILSQY